MITDRRRFGCVLVGIAATERFEATAALRYGCRLAAEQDARLTIHVMAPPLAPPLVAGPATASSWIAAAQHDCETLGAHTAAEATGFAAALGLSPIVSRCRDVLDARTARLTQLARVHDVTILDEAAGDPSGQRAVEDALFDSGSPIIVAPAEDFPPMPSRIVIAWDGSARAGRAVRDALPLLLQAQTVEVVTVMGEKDLSRMAPGADLAGYLSAHGVGSCALETLAAVDGSAAGRLLDHISSVGPDLLVMGAFVHSRLREAVLGGVTRSLLDRCPVPLLLSH